MTESLENHHIKYHIDEVEKIARKLQSVIMQRNNIEKEPTSGAQIQPIPVFEHERYSLLDFTKELTETDIIWPKTEPEFLPAYIIKKNRIESGNSAKIVVTANENYCTARLLAAKELMHCHITENGLPATTTLAELNELLDSLTIGAFLDNRSLADQIAWYGASEFLVPKTWIPLLKVIHSDISDMKTKLPETDATLSIAQLLRVPVPLINIKLR
ncbi:hypothetical protein [Ferrovum sp.]|uniref:hypothetical protein n=1 Tax=Ferrovum sp. TaxID=2609467 RepID=UPI002625E317|nr:hypothetical protein [Ferrovum sp.]